MGAKMLAPTAGQLGRIDNCVVRLPRRLLLFLLGDVASPGAVALLAANGALKKRRLRERGGLRVARLHRSRMTPQAIVFDPRIKPRVLFGVRRKLRRQPRIAFRSPPDRRLRRSTATAATASA